MIVQAVTIIIRTNRKAVLYMKNLTYRERAYPKNINNLFDINFCAILPVFLLMGNDNVFRRWEDVHTSIDFLTPVEF